MDINKFIKQLIIIGLCLLGVGASVFVLVTCLAVFSESPMTTATQSPPVIPQTVTKTWTLSNLSYTVTEKNSVWWKFSWQCTVTNETSNVMSCYVNVNFLDSGGYILEDDIENPPDFSAYEIRTVRGYGLIDTILASRVTKAEATVSGYIQRH